MQFRLKQVVAAPEETREVGQAYIFIDLSFCCSLFNMNVSSIFNRIIL